LLGFDPAYQVVQEPARLADLFVDRFRLAASEVEAIHAGSVAAALLNTSTPPERVAENGQEHVLQWWGMNDSTIKKLVEVAETLSIGPCRAEEHGQQPCPIQHDNRDDWCLRCLAAEAVAEYHQQ
jgi:hypothetical protein